jgi:hypothetical protein
MALRRALLVAAVGIAAPGCGGALADGPPTLGAVATGTHDGCISVKTGGDEDGDGVLGDDEATVTTELCAPARPPKCGDGKALTGRIVISTDADWDQLADVACIDGDLVITGVLDPELRNLAPLATVTGDVAIAGDPLFTTLGGLAGVQTIGGTLLVQGNDALADLTGAGGIPQLRELAIVGNRHLPDLTGLESFDCTTALRVTDNAELASLTGLDDHRCIGALTLARDPALTDVTALDHLTEAAAFELDSVPVGERFAPQLTSVAGQLRITGESFRRLELPALSGVGDLDVEDNGTLAVVDMPGLYGAANLRVANDPALVGLRVGIASAETIELVGLPALSAVQFGAISALGGTLDIEHTGLGALGAFGSIGKVGGDLILHGNGVPLRLERAFADHVEVGGSRSVD